VKISRERERERERESIRIRVLSGTVVGASTGEDGKPDKKKIAKKKQLQEEYAALLEKHQVPPTSSMSGVCVCRRRY